MLAIFIRIENSHANILQIPDTKTVRFYSLNLLINGGKGKGQISVRPDVKDLATFQILVRFKLSQLIKGCGTLE